MQLLAIRIPPEIIAKLFRLETKMGDAPDWRISNHVTPNSTPTSNPPNPMPSCSQPQPPKSRPGWRRDRVRDIFPPGLESKSRSIGSHYSFRPAHLKDVLSYHDDEEQPVVKEAWYGKQTKSAKHEFIVLHVEEPATGLRNCLAIDRNQANPASNIEAFSSPNADDTFKVSYDGDLKRLLQESSLQPHLVLERMFFQDNEPPLLKKLVALISHISMNHSTYNPVDTNCYWFTGLIWACMAKMYPTAKHEVIAPGRKGRISYIRIVPNPIQVRSVLKAVENENATNSGTSSSNDLAQAGEEGVCVNS